MILGGNSTLQKYFEENKVDVDSFTSFDQKFKTKECERYREKVVLFVSFDLRVKYTLILTSFVKKPNRC